jgi:branched-chain amino acid transport system ATP-binding protein
MSAVAVIEARGLEVFYSTSQILFGVDIEVMQGQTVALLGRNGAGKSTTMKAIAGLAPPRRGSVRLRGQDMTGRKPHVSAKAGLGYVPEDRQIFPEHTVEDNLIIARKKGPDGREEWPLDRLFETFPLLQPLRKRIAGRLSGGEQQLVAIARALAGNPIALLLDEPSEGLAPIIVQRIAETLHRLRAEGLTILLAEQNMHFCLGIASHAVVIDKGQIVYRDTIDGLKANDEVRRRYLAM